MLPIVALILSCNKVEIERFDTFTEVDMSATSDTFKELTSSGFVVRNEADFDTLMAWSGDTLSFPGLQGNEVLLICSQRIDEDNGVWTEFYSRKMENRDLQYEFIFMSERRPDYINGIWKTQAIKIELEQPDKEIIFIEKYRGS